MMQTLWQDLRYGARLLLKKPGFTLAVVFSLALGIGANAAIFTLVNAVLFRTAPVAEPDRLFFVFQGSQNQPFSVVSYPNYVDYRDRNEVFDGLAAFSEISVSLNEGDDLGQADLVRGQIVTGNFFELLGVRAAQGRTFLPEEDETPSTHPVAVISHGLWQRRFGGNPGIVGQQLALNGNKFTIVGVAAEGFRGQDILENYDVYVPMMMQSLMRPPRGGFSAEMDADLLSKRGGGWLRMMGRLKPGVSAAQAQAGVSNIARQLEQTYPNFNRGLIATIFPLTKIDPQFYPSLLVIATLLLAVVGMVLLIACANVANLLLARASTRRKEIAVRLALGAGRFRLIRQLLTESVMLSLAGGLAGLMLAWWTIDVLKTTVPTTGIFSFDLDYELNGRVLGFTLALSLLTGIIFGLVPALQASNPNIVPVLKDEAYVGGGIRRRLNLRNVLVVSQVALSLMLLIGAGLFLRSMRQAQGIDPGFDAERILTATLNINLLRYTKAQGREFYRQVTERVESLPGVQSASLARVVPISGGWRRSGLWVEGQVSPGAGDQQQNQQTIGTNVVSAKYFQTMGIGLRRGRDFTAQDDEVTPSVVIVNDAFVRRYFDGQEAVGKRISLNTPQGPWREIIGVAQDSKYRILSEDPQPFVYQPLMQNHESGMTLHVRTMGDPASLAGALRGEVHALEKNLPLTDIQPLETLLGSALFPARAGALLFAVFGILALLLAAVGLYGVMAYSVSQRTREIGIRVALGARTGDVLLMVVRQGMVLAMTGVAIGLAGALAATRLLANLLVGVSATDPATFVLIAVLLAAVALLACFIPARRASKVDPMIALRYE